MTAAPGSSMNPSRSRSRRLPPRCFQPISTSSIACAWAFGAWVPSSRRRSSGTVTIARTSWVAAAFIAEVTEACDHFPLLASRSSIRSSSELRTTEPVRPKSSSAAPKPVTATWFQFVDRAVLGVDALRMAVAAEEALPLVLAGPQRRQARVDPLVAERQPAARELGDVAVVDVEGVERLRRLRGRLEERLRRVHLAVGEPAEEELVERVLPVARALAGDRVRARR